MRLGYRACIALLLAAFVTGCAKHYANDAVQEPYGFFSGVWHGLFFVLALMANLISWTFSLVGISFFGLDSNCWQAQYRLLVLRRIYDWSIDSWRERK